MTIKVVTKKNPANNKWDVEVYSMVAMLSFNTEIEAHDASLLVTQTLRNTHDDDVERICADKKE